MSDVSLEVLLGDLLQGAVGAQLVQCLVEGFEQLRLTLTQCYARFLAREGFAGDAGVLGLLGVLQCGQAIDQGGVDAANAQVLELAWVVVVGFDFGLRDVLL
ncbi:hypothetical protein D3C87_1881290 [compost metagenome]